MQVVLDQSGKDCPWQPSPMGAVDGMLKLANVGPGDNLVDLGSGDGRIVIRASKLGASAAGIESEQNLIDLARENAMAAGVPATFNLGDLFDTDMSAADVITLYLCPEAMDRLGPAMRALRKGTRVVSLQFTFGDWPHDATALLPAPVGLHFKPYLWVV